MLLCLHAQAGDIVGSFHYGADRVEAAVKVGPASAHGVRGRSRQHAPPGLPLHASPGLPLHARASPAAGGQLRLVSWERAPDSSAAHYPG